MLSVPGVRGWKSGMTPDEQVAGPVSEVERYRILVEAIAGYAICMLAPGGTVTSWNSGAQHYTGYTPAEIIGQNFARFYTDEERAAGKPALALQTAAREGRFEAEGWRVRKDGTRFWASVVIDAIRDPAGRLTGFAEVSRDLTERRAAQEALRRTEEQFRLLVQGVTDYAIYMLDPDGMVSSWNAGAERIKGYRPEEIVGHHFARFYTPEDRERGEPQRSLDIVRREGRVEREGWRVRKDGTRFWASVVIDPIRDDAGEIVGFAKITRDSTERKLAQDALDQAREALLQSRKMEAIGQLTGGVAHDFNNLLMAVLGSLELLRKRLPDDPAMRRLIDNATQGARRGVSLTQRMLAFARRQELKPAAVDVAALVLGMGDLLQRSLGPHVAVEMRLAPGLPAVRTDPERLETALLNLAINARDAMPGGGRIVISAREDSIVAPWSGGLLPGDYLRIAVTDTGEGMDEATLARAVEPFFTTMGVGQGTGLGLPMVHGLAEQSGGRLVLTSRPGEGTTAELWLPVTTEESASASPEPAQHPAGTRSLAILAVDDDPLVLTSTAGMLEDLGHRVHEATSAAMALDILQRQPALDLVITDHAMPQMTGAELADRIARERPSLPVVLATGFAELPAGRAAGLPRLAKPFDQGELQRVIDTVVARR